MKTNNNTLIKNLKEDQRVYSRIERRWPLSVRKDTVCDTNITVKLDTFPEYGELLSSDWIRFLLKEGVILSYSCMGDTWELCDEHHVNGYYCLPFPPQKSMLKKTVDELPYSFVVVTKDGYDCEEVSKNKYTKKLITQQRIDQWVKTGQKYTVDGIEFHPFVVIT